MHKVNKIPYIVTNEVTGKQHIEQYRTDEQPQRQGYTFLAKVQNKAKRIYKDRWIEVITWIE